MLISVKNLAEARIAAVTEGISIVDVKNPLQGSLGFAGPATVNQIVEMVDEENAKSIFGMGDDRNSCKKSVSVALGELDDVNKQEIQQIDWAKIEYAKVGLYNAYQNHRWRKPLADIFADVPTHVARVLVLYVDQIANAASQETLTVAHEDGMSVVLLDTFDKSRGNVFAHWSEVDCQKVFISASQFEMKTVLAGSIGVSDLPLALNTRADLIGVRGAVCKGDRKSELSQKQLNDFINAYSDAATDFGFITQPLGEPG